MIEKIVITPREVGGVDLELHGDLARSLSLGAKTEKAPARDEPGLSFSLVAGARFELTTFRL